LRRLLWSRQEKKIHCAVCFSRGKKKKSTAPFAIVAARKKNPLRRLLWSRQEKKIHCAVCYNRFTEKNRWVGAYYAEIQREKARNDL
jgi:hypothetical protein